MKKSNYPRIYKPNAETLFECAFVCFIFLALNAIEFIVHPEFYSLHQTGVNFFGMITLIVGSIVVPYVLIIRAIGYKVTLLPDAIEVTTLLSTKLLHRSDLNSYSYYFGKYEHGIDLLSGNRHKSLDDRLSQYTNEILVRIPITFDRDQEFDDWVTSLPCISGGMPLPKNYKKRRGRA